MIYINLNVDGIPILEVLFEGIYLRSAIFDKYLWINNLILLPAENALKSQGVSGNCCLLNWTLLIIIKSRSIIEAPRRKQRGTEFTSSAKPICSHDSTGENICKQGAFATSIIYILHGLVKLIIEGPGNKRYILRILKPSEFIGFSSVFGENKYHYSAVALTNTTVCLMEKDILNKLIRENNEIANEIIKWHCNIETHHYRKFESLAYKQLHGRLADTLLYLDQENFDIKNIYSYLAGEN